MKGSFLSMVFLEVRKEKEILAARFTDFSKMGNISTTGQMVVKSPSLRTKGGENCFAALLSCKL